MSNKASPMRKSTSSPKGKIRFGARMKNMPVSFQIRSFGFPPFGVECFDYSRVNGDRRDKGYTIPFRRCMEAEDDDEAVIPTLTGAGFFAAAFQRQSIFVNDRKTGSDNWPRYWMIREVPGGNPSSVETRREGMEFLKAFFIDPRNTRYPPKSIECMDHTSERPSAMQHFFIDRDILRILARVVDEEFHNPMFYRSFPNHAAVAFPGPTFPADAVMALGFGNPNPFNHDCGAYAPNFVPGAQNNVPQGRSGDATNEEVPTNGEGNQRVDAARDSDSEEEEEE